MSMRRRAALLLAAFAEVVGASILCADPNDFDGSAMMSGPDETCQMVVNAYLSAYAGFDSLTAAQCNTTIVDGGGPGGSNLTLRGALKYMIYCCSGQPTAEACGPLFPEHQNPCASAADFEPHAEVGEGDCRGDEDITDQQACEAVGYEAWDPNAEEKCDVGRIDADLNVRQAACAQLGGSWAQSTCFEMAMNLGNATFTADTCSVRHPHIGNASTTMLLNYLGGSCCGSPENMKTVCDPFADGGLPNPCYNLADFVPSMPLDPDNPSSPTCKDYITYAFQDAYTSMSPPVLCNFTVAECARDLSETFGSEPGDLTVGVFLQSFGRMCCGGGMPTPACTTLQGTMPCHGGNSSSPHNVTCHEIKAFHTEHNCCRNSSWMCAEVKRHFREHACCGMPAKHVPAPSFMSR